jgi:NADH-quinone oxidoreductase subunit N
LAKIALNFDFFESFVRLSTFSLIFSDRLLLGLLFLLAGLLFKLAAAPFHMWSPDVYEGSPTSISMLFAVVPKIGLFTVALRLFFFVFYDFIFIWQKVIILCSFLSILIGTFATLRQYRIKRFLAFSSVTHVGYLLIAFSTGTFEGISSLFFYLIVYVVMLLNAWSIVILLELKKQKNIVRLRYITDLQNLSKVNPVLGFTFLINLFSMAGVPPLAGFYAKVFIFFSAIECSLNILVIFGILLSVVSAFYYIRFIKIVYFDETFNSLFLVQQISLIQAYVLGFTFYFILFLFIKPEILFLLVEKVSLSLFL